MLSKPNSEVHPEVFFTRRFLSSNLDEILIQMHWFHLDDLWIQTKTTHLDSIRDRSRQARADMQLGIGLGQLLLRRISPHLLRCAKGKDHRVKSP